MPRQPLQSVIFRIADLLTDGAPRRYRADLHLLLAPLLHEFFEHCTDAVLDRRLADFEHRSITRTELNDAIEPLAAQVKQLELVVHGVAAAAHGRDPIEQLPSFDEIMREEEPAPDRAEPSH